MPDILKAIILGVIQGLTEFLPISSSGHLIFVPWLFGWEPFGLAFDVALHLGTLLAVLIYFRNEALKCFKGDSEDVAYYTNSVHLAAEAPVCLVERIEKQAMFHSIIESGAITHAFIGEEKPSPQAIATLMEKVLRRTQSAQVTISPEFTYCNSCGHQSRGLQDKCQQCGSYEVVGETRVVGYFSKIQNWNKSKRFGELVNRQRGRYAVETAESESPARLETAAGGE